MRSRAVDRSLLAQLTACKKSIWAPGSGLHANEKTINDALGSDAQSPEIVIFLHAVSWASQQIFSFPIPSRPLLDPLLSACCEHDPRCTLPRWCSLPHRQASRKSRLKSLIRSHVNARQRVCRKGTTAYREPDASDQHAELVSRDARPRQTEVPHQSSRPRPPCGHLRAARAATLYTCATPLERADCRAAGRRRPPR